MGKRINKIILKNGKQGFAIEATWFFGLLGTGEYLTLESSNDTWELDSEGFRRYCFTSGIEKIEERINRPIKDKKVCTVSLNRLKAEKLIGVDND